MGYIRCVPASYGTFVYFLTYSKTYLFCRYEEMNFRWNYYSLRYRIFLYVYLFSISINLPIWLEYITGKVADFECRERYRITNRIKKEYHQK